jgi:hypothetical protein
MNKRNISMYIKRGTDGHDEFAIEEMNLANAAAFGRPPFLDIPFNNQDAKNPATQRRSSLFDGLISGGSENRDSDSIEFESSSGRGSTCIPRTKDFIELRSNLSRKNYYRMGIIDFLQPYNNRKKVETKYLRYRFKNKPPDCFSCVPPKIYADRFYEFLRDNLFTNERTFPDFE